MDIKIIYKDKDFLVLNKPAGILVHGLRIRNKELGIKNYESEETVVDWLLKNFPEVKNVGDDPENRPGIVHRLDRDTSGVLVVVRNQEAFNYLKNIFQKHQVKKTYLALVYGTPNNELGIKNPSFAPQSGAMVGEQELWHEIKKPIGLKSDSVKRTVFTKNAVMVKEAVTKYKIKKTFDYNGQKFSLLEIEPLTGRTHQIRVHLASIGHPIVGDKLYGPKNQTIKLDRQFLHADSIEFTLPNSSRLKVSTDLPEELSRFLSNLRSFTF